MGLSIFMTDIVRPEFYCETFFIFNATFAVRKHLIWIVNKVDEDKQRMGETT